MKGIGVALLGLIGLLILIGITSGPEKTSTVAPSNPTSANDDPASAQLRSMLQLTVESMKSKCGEPIHVNASQIFVEGVPHKSVVMLYRTTNGLISGANFVEAKVGDGLMFAGITTGMQWQMGAIIGDKKQYLITDSNGRDEIATLLPCVVQ